MSIGIRPQPVRIAQNRCSCEPRSGIYGHRPNVLVALAYSLRSGLLRGRGGGLVLCR